jgi:UDP-glucuronate 4-epimerase
MSTLKLPQTPVLVTGAAGFIGFHTVRRLLAAGFEVDGVDNLSGAADPMLQQARWRFLSGLSGFRPLEMDLAQNAPVQQLFEQRQYNQVIHLAARVGVRDSVRKPEAFLQSNLQGFLNLLEACRRAPLRHLIYASSSSVYGARESGPFAEDSVTDQPVSFYAASKRSNELMAHAWSELHGIAATGLRFFTVYGPWGRPDMAIYRFTRAILNGKPIRLYNGGCMRRDFTYVDDAVEVIMRTMTAAPAKTRVMNVGGGRPVELSHLVATMEQVLELPAKMEMLPMQAGDVPLTSADTKRLREVLNYAPTTDLEDGIRKFAAWFRNYHGLSRTDQKRVLMER